MRRVSDTQKVRDALEASDLPCTDDKAGPMSNIPGPNNTRKIIVREAGYFPLFPLREQWLINDFLKDFFGKRLVRVYLSPYCAWPSPQQLRWSFVVEVRA